ncbi:MAG: tetratricopeptide repeat protein [bacterium]
MMRIEINDKGIKLNMLWLKSTIGWDDVLGLTTEYDQRSGRFITTITTSEVNITDIYRPVFDSNTKGYCQILHQILNNSPNATIDLTTEIFANFPDPALNDEKEYRDRLGYNPADVISRLNLAYIYLQQVELKKAIKQLKEVIRQLSTNFEAYFVLGCIFLIKKSEKKAIIFFEQAFQYNPNHLTNKRYLSRAYFLNGKTARAITLLENNIKIDPYHFESYIDLCENLVATNKYDQALAKLKEVAEAINNYRQRAKEEFPPAELVRLKRIEKTIEEKSGYVERIKTDTSFRRKIKAKNMSIKILTILAIIGMIISILMKIIEIFFHSLP